VPATERKMRVLILYWSKKEPKIKIHTMRTFPEKREEPEE
jgi:hypothetical protein